MLLSIFIFLHIKVFDSLVFIKNFTFLTAEIWDQEGAISMLVTLAWTLNAVYCGPKMALGLILCKVFLPFPKCPQCHTCRLNSQSFPMLFFWHILISSILSVKKTTYNLEQHLLKAFALKLIIFGYISYMKYSVKHIWRNKTRVLKGYSRRFL